MLRWFCLGTILSRSGAPNSFCQCSRRRVREFWKARCRAFSFSSDKHRSSWPWAPKLSFFSLQWISRGYFLECVTVFRPAGENAVALHWKVFRLSSSHSLAHLPTLRHNTPVFLPPLEKAFLRVISSPVQEKLLDSIPIGQMCNQVRRWEHLVRTVVCVCLVGVCRKAPDQQRNVNQLRTSTWLVHTRPNWV